MTPGIHAFAAVAAASLVPGVVHASESGDVSVWMAAVAGGLLPNALDWLFRATARDDVVYTPDPALPPETIAAETARAVARLVARPLVTGRPVRLRIRPLPAGAGLLELRFLQRRCCARVVAETDPPRNLVEPVSSRPVRVPEMPPVWPATVPVVPPDGTVLEVRPQTGSTVRLDVRAPGRGRGLGHSAPILAAASVALFASENAACAAAGAGLLAHGALDAVGLQGIPLMGRRGRFVALRLWNDASASARRAAAVLCWLAATAGFLLHTAYLGHGRRLAAAVFAALAVFSWGWHRRGQGRTTPARPPCRPSGA